MKRLLLMLVILSPLSAWAAYQPAGICEEDLRCNVPFQAFDATDPNTPESAMTTIATCKWSEDGASWANCDATSVTILTNCTDSITETDPGGTVRYCREDATNAPGQYQLNIPSINDSGDLSTATSGLVRVVITSTAAQQISLLFTISNSTISGIPTNVLDTSLSSHRTSGTVGGQLGKIH